MKFGHVILTMDSIDAVLYEPAVEGQERKTRKMPFKLRYRLTKIQDALQKDFEFYEAERVKLVHQYGTEVEVEGTKKLEVVEEESRKKFFADLEEILKTDISAKFTPLTEEDIEPIADIDIDFTENQLRAFMAFVMESNEEEPAIEAEEE